LAKSDIRLGRGLGALLSENVDVGVADGTEFEIPLEDLKPNPYQPRGPASDDGLAKLAESIREHGLLQPLVVRSRDAHWEIVAGERRWRALMLLERRAAPAIVREFSDEEMLLVALVENLQREALSALEEARSYQQLADEFGLTQRDIARRVGKDRSTVANALRLLTPPASVQELVHTGEISAGHARAILGAREEAAQLILAKRVVSRGLSVRETERRVRRLREGASTRGAARDGADGWSDPYIRRAQQALERALGTEVAVRLKGKAAGEIRVVFHDAEDFDRLLSLMAGRSAAEL
jgi:ParB family chromosome partitioning protein